MTNQMSREEAESLYPDFIKFNDVREEISYKDGYRLILSRDKQDPTGRYYFQVECDRPDSSTGEMGVGRGGKAYLSPHMTVSELTRVAFGLFKAYEEHECREFFNWKNRAIFGPHVSSEALWEVAESLDYRTEYRDPALDILRAASESPTITRTRKRRNTQ